MWASPPTAVHRNCILPFVRRRRCSAGRARPSWPIGLLTGLELSCNFIWHIAETERCAKQFCMNWQAVSFDWNQIRALLATAEEGSFTGAARVLKTTQPTVGRQISALEQSLGITLVERTIKGPILTQAGLELLNHVKAMADAATLISMTAAGHSQEVSGEVKITSTDLMATGILPDVLAPLRKTAPGVRIKIVATGHTLNLLAREADIAVRHGRPDQPDLIARHIGDFGLGLYASSEYLKAFGRPRTPEEVAHHAFVGTPDPERLIKPLSARGIDLRPENFVLSSDSNVVQWQWLRAGFGISMLPDILGETDPLLEKILPDLPMYQAPIWLVTHRELRTSPRIRVVFDTLANGLMALMKSEKSASPSKTPVSA